MPESDNPSYGLSDHHVKSALVADKGSDAILQNWTVVDFTKKGDNYVCVVSSIRVNFTCLGQDHQTSYVIKISSNEAMVGFKDAIDFMCQSEVKFYEELLPVLNKRLSDAGQPNLNFPRCFYTCTVDNRKIMFMDDLREKGFKMHDRQQGLDAAHTSLTVKELARLHAASLLLQSNGTPSSSSLLEIYPGLAKFCFSVTPEAREFFQNFMFGHIDNAILALEKVGSYASSVRWLQSMRPSVVDQLEGKSDSESSLKVLCHGDCWTNNMLFRYDESGLPVEVMLVDAQLIRMSSPAVDLNYMLFTSLEGTVRSQNSQAFLDAYHSTLTQVCSAGGLSEPLTTHELKVEYRRKHTFGALFSVLAVPVVICEGEDAPDFLSMSEENMEKFIEKQKTNILNKLIKNPLFKPRLLAIFDELVDCGIIAD